MGLDIRLPIGLMFLLLGPVLLVSGLIGAEPLSTRTGLCMSVFGAGMLTFGVRGQRRSNALARDATPR